MRDRSPSLRRDLTLALVAKLLLLAVLLVLVILPAIKPSNDPAATATAVVGAVPTEQAK